MVNLTADPGVVIIDVLTGRDEASVRIIDLYLPAVRDAEQFIVVAGDKADAVVMRIIPVRLSIGSSGVLDLIQGAKSNSGNHFTLEADLLNRHHPGTGKRIPNRILQHILIGDQAGVLGSTGSIQGREASNTSLAVTSAGRTLLIDVSGSPIQALKRSSIDPLSVDVLLLTHAHIDHIYALPSLIHQMWLMGRTADLTIVANKETIEVAQSLCALFSLAEKRGIFAVNWQVAEEGRAAVTVGKMAITLFSVPHGIPTLGCTLEEGDEKVVYLADCKSSGSYPPCAWKADLLIHEAGGVGGEEEQLM